MNRRLIDLGESVAKIEPAENGQPYITLFNEEGSFVISCDVDCVERFAFALEAAVGEYREKLALDNPGGGV